MNPIKTTIDIDLDVMSRLQALSSLVSPLYYSLDLLFRSLISGITKEKISNRYVKGVLGY